MAKKVYNVTLVGEIEIELDDAVIEAGGSNEYKDVMGYTMKPQETAEHLAYNMLINNALLENLDGFADQPNSNAKIKRTNWRFDDQL